MPSMTTYNLMIPLFQTLSLSPWLSRCLRWWTHLYGSQISWSWEKTGPHEWLLKMASSWFWFCILKARRRSHQYILILKGIYIYRYICYWSTGSSHIIVRSSFVHHFKGTFVVPVVRNLRLVYILKHNFQVQNKKLLNLSKYKVRCEISGSNHCLWKACAGKKKEWMAKGGTSYKVTFSTRLMRYMWGAILSR